MPRFGFFSSFNSEKNQGKYNSKSKESTDIEDNHKKITTHVRSMTPIIECKSLEGALMDTQKSCGDLAIKNRQHDSLLDISKRNLNASSDSSSCDAPITKKENSIVKVALDDTIVGKTSKPNFRRTKTPINKDQRLKQLEKEMLEKDQLIYSLNEEISRLSEKLGLLETSVREKSLNEQVKLKNRRLPDVSSEANPGSLASLSASLVKHPKSVSVRDFLIKTISTNEYFVHHDIVQIKEMISCMYRIGVNNGENLTNENDDDDGNTLYVISSGVFDIYKENIKQGSLFSGDCLGETMILCKSSTKTTCVAASDECVVWALDRKTYKGIMLKFKMKLQNDYANLLRQVSIFSQLPDTLILNIISIVQEQVFQRGEYIYRIGDLGTSFYIVKEGSVNIFKKTSKQATHPTLVKKLGRGSQFGENVLMIHERYSEDARAGDHDCTVLGIECEDFNNLLGYEEIGLDASIIESVNTPVTREKKPPAYSENSAPSARTVHTTQSLDLNYKSFGKPQTYKVEQDHNIKLEDLKSVCTVAHCSISQLEIAYMKNCPSNLFLLKQFKKKQIVDAGLQEKIMTEKKMLMTCNSPFIVRLHRTFKDRKYLYMLLEGCSGGDLASLLHDRKLFAEFHARFYIGCVIEALSFLHKHSIIFRSLKPESILIDDKGYAKVADLGNAKKVGNSKRTYTFTGKPEYVAPEIILNKGYDTSVDFWALGILIFELTCGHVPFKANDSMKTYNLILKGFDSMVFPVSVSKNAVRLIRRLCKTCPTERIGYNKGSWSEVKKCSWFENFDWVNLSKKVLEPPITPNVLDRIEILNDLFVKDDEIPPDEMSGWDKDF